MQYLNEPELKRILLAIPDPRLRLMVLVTFWHGLRASETINLKGRDIQGGYVYVKRLKGSNKTTQAFQTHEDPLLDEATGLTRLARTVRDNEKVFPGKSRFGFYKLMRRAGKRAGFAYSKKVRPHILKHSIAMQTIHEAGIENLQAWLGHKSLSSTGKYLHVTDDEAGAAIGKAIRDKDRAAANRT